jgi:hypothetical protein
MRLSRPGAATATILAAYLAHTPTATAGPGYTVVSVIANVTPIVSALYAPQCLPGYVLCKVSFATASVGAAAGQLLLSGWTDTAQTRAILYRGFGGDWILTSAHVSGKEQAQPLPTPPPPPEGDDADGEWVPPPI